MQGYDYYYHTYQNLSNAMDFALLCYMEGVEFLCNMTYCVCAFFGYSKTYAKVALEAIQNGNFISKYDRPATPLRDYLRLFP